jgi:hypothetical protein
MSTFTTPRPARKRASLQGPISWTTWSVPPSLPGRRRRPGSPGRRRRLGFPGRVRGRVRGRGRALAAEPGAVQVEAAERAACRWAASRRAVVSLREARAGRGLESALRRSRDATVARVRAPRPSPYMRRRGGVPRRARRCCVRSRARPHAGCPCAPRTRGFESRMPRLSGGQAPL